MDDELKYSYASKPRAVQTNRSKGLRDPADRPPGKPAQPNIMYDPRIVRGSVFAAHTMISPRRGSNNNNSNNKPKKRRSQSGQKTNIFESPKIASYASAPISLEANLIEQAPAVSDREQFSQTDEFVRYITPTKKIATTDGKFQRPKVGVDSGTQIEPSDKLFNFDVEVKPLLNVLVNKTLAQALAEVKEEMEMKNIIHERKVLLDSKADMARVDRELEDKAKEAFRQKEEKKREQELKREQARVMKEKVLAWQVAHETTKKAIAQMTLTLEAKGVFYNPLHRELTEWLSSEIYDGSDTKLQLRQLASALLDNMLFESLRRESLLARLLPHEQEALVRITLKDPVLVPIVDEEGATTSTTELTVIGPVALSRLDSLTAIEDKLQAWVTENVGAGASIPLGGLLSFLNLAESI
ncbi:hypothetical protein Poli38472_000782 [Pythium oligandrum]|uniref:Radial spoke protein 3 n=1 Tax=Pythium oligandrum TaxID=41045 RepID=A0A8K1CDD7_PYTOL|nr:hypothetical protein Poli38472_000782 [Pythium oligandrum]|eukprot:TMW60740.1 hypothetical protein Poli38472_000782 [Pythium oligandrum]